MEATLQQLIDMCTTVGWDVGIRELEKLIDQEENRLVFFQETGQHKQAAAMTAKIAKQKFAVAKLKAYRVNNSL